MKTKVTQYNIGLLSHKDMVRFALFCAKQVDSKAPEAIACVDVVERWLVGEATSDECNAAANAANAYYVGAAYYAARAAYYTAYTANYATDAAHAAYSTAHNTAQARYLYELLHINDIIEQTLLANN